MRDSMKNSGDAIERVLAGLRDVEVPAGLERRILDGLERRTSRPTDAGWRWFGPVWRGVPARYTACGVVAAGVVVFALTLPIVRRIEDGSVQSKMGVTPTVSVPAHSVVAVKEAEIVSHETGVRTVKTDVARANLERAGDSVGDSEGSVAESEMRAMSFPAPPMPLTEEERLLLRLAHKNDLVELAMLDPKLRELRDAEEEAEFQRFFARPAVVLPTESSELSVIPSTTERSSADQVVQEQPMTGQGAPPTVDSNQSTTQPTEPKE